MEIPTVRVKHPELAGGMLINESDYDPALHEPADETSAIRCEALAPAKPQPNTASTSGDGQLEASRAARRAELEVLSFVELKEKIADLGVATVKVGTSKEDLVVLIQQLEEKAATDLVETVNDARVAEREAAGPPEAQK
jgi:hypothetical protein